jgi:hypothetical protein
MKKKMITNVYQEICCEECNEVIHNHFDCPVCNSSYGNEPTDQYGYIDNYAADIQCEKCDTVFEKVSKESSWNDSDVEVRIKRTIQELRDEIIKDIIDEDV